MSTFLDSFPKLRITAIVTIFRLSLVGYVLIYAASNLTPNELNIWLLFNMIASVGLGLFLILGNNLGKFLVYLTSGIHPAHFRRRFDEFVKKDQTDAIKYWRSINESAQLIVRNIAAVYGLISGCFCYFYISSVSANIDTTVLMVCAAAITIGAVLIVWSTRFLVLIIGKDLLHQFQYYQLGVLIFAAGVFSLFSFYIGSRQFEFLTSMGLILCSVQPLASFLFISRKNFDTGTLIRPDAATAIIWRTLRYNVMTFTLASLVKNVAPFFVSGLLTNTMDSTSFLFLKRLFDVLDTFISSISQIYVGTVSAIDLNNKRDEAVHIIRGLMWLGHMLVTCFTVTVIFLIKFDLFIFIGIDLDFDVYLCFSLGVAALIVRWGATWMFVMNCLNKVLEHRAIVFYFFGFFSLLILSGPLIGTFSYPSALIFGIALSMFIIGRELYLILEIPWLQFEKYSIIPAFLLVNIVGIWLVGGL